MKPLPPKKSTMVKSHTLAWPCYACVFNNREDGAEPCLLCTENTTADRYTEKYKNRFEPILEPE